MQKHHEQNLNFPQLFIPPQKLESPYKAGEINPNTFAADRVEVEMPEKRFQPPQEKNPDFYTTPEDYQKNTGRPLISLAYFESRPLIQRSSLQITGKRIGDKFVEQNGELFLIKKDNLIKICNFIIEIRHITERISVSATSIEIVDIEVGQHQKHIVSVPLTQFRTLVSKIISNSPQLHFDSAFGNRAKEYFAEYSSLKYEMAAAKIEKKFIFCFHGWAKIGTEMVFLSSALPFCESDCYVPPVFQEQIRQIYADGFSFLKIGKSVNSINSASSLKAILPIFLYSHAGYTAKLFEQAGLNLQFILAIIGTTGSFKTSLCKVLCEAFNTQSMLNFQSTPRAIELYRDSCRDMTMIMDDIFSCKDKETMAKFETVLRCFGDNIAKAKSNVTADKIQQFPVRGGCIITAENNLPSQQSSALRLLVVKVNNESFNGKTLKIFQDNQVLAKRNQIASRLQLYFSAYIQHLQSNFEEIVKMIQTFEPPPMKIKFPRLAATYKAMSILSNIVVQWGMKIGILSPEESENLLALWYSVIQEIIADNLQLSEVSAPHKLFLTNITQGMATGMFPLASNKKNYDDRGSKDYFGYVDEENSYYVLDPYKSFRYLEDFLKNNGQAVAFTQQTLLHQLYEQKMSVGYTEKYKTMAGEQRERTRYTKKIKINQQSAQMLVLKIDAVNKVTNE